MEKDDITVNEKEVTRVEKDIEIFNSFFLVHLSYENGELDRAYLRKNSVGGGDFYLNLNDDLINNLIGILVKAKEMIEKNE